MAALESPARLSVSSACPDRDPCVHGIAGGHAARELLAREAPATSWPGCRMVMQENTAPRGFTRQICKVFFDLLPIGDMMWESTAQARRPTTEDWPTASGQKGVWSRALRERSSTNPPPTSTSVSRARSPRHSRRTFASLLPLSTQASSPLVNTMLIEPLGSNRIARPLGTGRSPMHGGSPMGSWRRSAHGPQGTAQGNRESAMQGGTPAPSGSLPFQSSGLRRAIVGTTKVHTVIRSPLELVGSTARGFSPSLP